MATSLKESKKRDPDQLYSFGANITKIGPVDPEIIGLQSKKI